MQVGSPHACSARPPLLHATFASREKVAALARLQSASSAMVYELMAIVGQGRLLAGAERGRDRDSGVGLRACRKPEGQGGVRGGGGRRQAMRLLGF